MFAELKIWTVEFHEYPYYLLLKILLLPFFLTVGI